MKEKEQVRYAVLICVRNEEEGIEATLDTVMSQSVKPRHVVVVNDGSTDRTGEVLRRYRNTGRARGVNLAIVTRPDRGFSALGTYLMADVYNSGLSYLLSLKDWDFLLILAAAYRSKTRRA